MVAASPPRIVEPLQDVSVEEGHPATFRCSFYSEQGKQTVLHIGESKAAHCIRLLVVENRCQFRGVPHTNTDVQVNWYKEGQPIQSSPYYRTFSSANSHSLVVMECFKEDEGRYTSVASNSSGQVDCSASLSVRGEAEKRAF